MDGWWILLAFVAVAVAAGLQWWMKQRRLEEFRTAARQFGFHYSARDLDGLLQLPFPLFERGDGRKVEHVLAGEWQGLEVRAFDYEYWEEHRDAEGHRSKTTYRFSCAVTWIEALCPPLAVSRENLLTRAAGAVGLGDIEMESEAFNRSFHVRSGDRRFAYEFLDARMMQALLGARDSFNYEAAGRGLLVYGPRVKPLGIIPLVGTLKAFHDQVPRVVYELRGAGGETKPGQIT